MVIQVLLIATLLAALIMTWRRVRQGVLSRLAGFLWSALWVAGGIVVLQPEFASLLARFLGVGRGVDAVIYVAIVGLFYLVFRIFLKLDRLERDITAIVRKVSLEEAERLNKGQGKGDEPYEGNSQEGDAG